MYKERLKNATGRKEKLVIGREALREFYLICLDALNDEKTKIEIKTGGEILILDEDMKQVTEKNLDKVKKNISEKLRTVDSIDLSDVMCQNVAILVDSIR